MRIGVLRPVSAALVACVALLPGGAASVSPRPKLVVAGDRANAPYEYLEDGRPTGFNVELMRAAGEIAGFDVEIRLGPWAQARRDLEEGRIDALSGMYWSEERSERVEFSVPHTMVRSALFVREDSPIRSFADLRGKEVIVQDGDAVHDRLKRMGLASRIVAVTDPEDQLRLLAAGRGDGAVMASRLQGEYYARRLGLEGLRIIDADLPELRYCFAVRKGNGELLYRLDEGLNVLKVSGKYREIYERWFGVYERPDLWRSARVLAVALAILTVLLAASLLWSRSLERSVRLRTAALQASEEELRRANGELRQPHAELREAHDELREAHDELREAHDELERRVVERTAELQDSNERLRVSEAEKALILNSTSDLVHFLDLEMRIQWGNQQAATYARTTLDGLNGRHCFEAFHGRSTPCPGCPAVLAMATGEPHSAEISRPGNLMIFHRAYPVKDERGQVIGAAAFVQDITDRKRDEEALRDGEERFHTLADNIAQLAWMTDDSGEISWFNRRCLDYTGASQSALQLGRFLHPDHVGRVAEKMSRSLSTGEEFEDTFPLRGKDGRYRWFLSRTVPVRDGAGQVLRWLGTATDVTEQREVDDALRESEARASAILASLAEGVIVHGADGRVTATNESAERLLGASREEVLGRTMLDDPLRRRMLRPDGSPFPPEEHPVTSVLRTGSSRTDVEVGWRRPDGTIAWLATHAQPVRLPDGRVAGVVSSFFDVTQRRHALERSEEHLRSMADNVPDAIVRYDRELRIRFANEAAADAIGAPLDQLIGKTRTELGMPPERARFWDEYARKVFRTGAGERFEFGFDARDGSCYESRIVPERDRDGAVETVLAITRDITDRKQAERQLLASRHQLRELVARLNSVREEEKVRLSRELHDEMGQLLTALKLELEALEDRLGDRQMPEAVRELLERAVAASDLVEKTIRSMRNVLSALRPVALDRLGLDAALREECRRFEEWSQVGCDFAPADGLSSFGVEIDTALFRIAQEALTNVARHAGARRVAVSLGWSDGAALLGVEDDGRGIPPGRESAGLGLLGMRERAERLGGMLAVKTAPRGGTRIEACIPVGASTSRKDVS